MVRAARLSRPITDLAASAESVAHGNYDVQVPDGGFGAELHTLAVSFQDMTHSLATTDEARAQLLSDLSHEIRTPLATLEAHIDGLEDGRGEAHAQHLRRDARTGAPTAPLGQRRTARSAGSGTRLGPPSRAGGCSRSGGGGSYTLYEPRFREKGITLEDDCQSVLDVVRVDRDSGCRRCSGICWRTPFGTHRQGEG